MHRSLSLKAFVRVAVLLATLPTSALRAEDTPPQLGLPLDCRLRETCWIANYVDVDSSRGAQDFRCGPRAYEGHDGVDFAIRDLGVMAQGVPVLASAGGTVENVRDGMPDVAITDEASRRRIAGRECGNGVVIDHVGGWQTQYCHLRKGSVRVRAGQQVETGAALGMVGLSGHSEFPHVHLSVRRSGTKLDPFTGRALSEGCGKAGTPLWRAELALNYEGVALYNAGVSPSAPDIDAIRRGEAAPTELPASAPALVMWIDMFGVQAGDSLHFRLYGPGGATLLEREQRIEKTQARRFVYVGMRRKGAAWNAGTYRVEIAHARMTDAQPVVQTIERGVRVRE